MMWARKKAFLIMALLICLSGMISSQEIQQTTFTGKVVDAEGRPIAGATANFYDGIYSPLMYIDYEQVKETTSDANGEFSFIRETDYPYAYIVVEQEGLTLDCAEWNKRESREFEFRLVRGEELSGIVVDENGEPVSDAQVSILMLTIGDSEERHMLSSNVAPKILNTITDEKGQFSFINMPVDAEVEFLVKKAGKATISTNRFELLPDQDEIRIVQPSESKIEGTVIDKDSEQPVLGVGLVIKRNQYEIVYGQDLITSQDDGSFIINGLTAGNYKLMLSVPQDDMAEWVAQPVSIELEAGQTKSDVKIELGKGGFFEAVITDADTQKPLEGASVYLHSNRMSQSFSNTADKEGIVQIRLLPGVYELSSVYMDGYSGISDRQTITIVEGSTERNQWQLRPMPSVSGIVTDQNDKPIEGVSFRILPRGGISEAISDSEGKYTIDWNTEALPGEEQAIPLLVCRYEEGNLATVVMVDAGTKTLDIKLKSGITIRGKVEDPVGKPIADARIRMMLRQTMWASTFLRSTITTDAEGNYEVSAIPSEHRYQINVSADGYGSDEIEIHADNAINNILDVNDITLPIANLTVSGILVDTEGEPIANARIESYNYEGGQPERLSIQTDSQGRFTFEGVCQGEFNIRVSTTVNGRRISARAIAFGGASDIKIVATEGTSSPVQYFRSESYEEILQNSENIIAGVVVNEAGLPVADVPVVVCCVISEYEPGRYRWSYADFSEFSARTDELGRFAIPLDTDNERYQGERYNLRFSPQDYAGDIVYDIPNCTKDLKVVLNQGGTISGRLVRMEGNKKVPIANVEVKLEQESRAAYTHLGFDRDQTTITDSDGRFKFEHIQNKIRPRDSRSDIEWEPVPRVWLISYGDTNDSIVFYDNTAINDFELIVNPTELLLTVGNALPDFDGITIDLPEEQIKDKMILVCFFDYEQRPSRNAVLQLAEQADELEQEGIITVAIQASTIEQDTLDKWVNENNISFPVGMIEESEEETRFNWGVKSLPWLILTDKEHIVIAEGFSIAELYEKVEETVDN